MIESVLLSHMCTFRECTASIDIAAVHVDTQQPHLKVPQQPQPRGPVVAAAEDDRPESRVTVIFLLPAMIPASIRILSLSPGKVLLLVAGSASSSKEDVKLDPKPTHCAPKT
jgi:hypothetical protein